jgi:hypothetical protein
MPYTQERLDEKGVDIGLAVDMVSQVDAYDVAVLVSGDYDFAEAIRFVKSRGKRVYLITVEPGAPGELRGQAWGLRVLVDRVTPVFESDLKSPQCAILRDPARHREDPDRPPRGGGNRERDRDAPSLPLGYREGAAGPPRG